MGCDRLVAGTVLASQAEHAGDHRPGDQDDPQGLGTDLRVLGRWYGRYRPINRADPLLDILLREPHDMAAAPDVFARPGPPLA